MNTTKELNYNLYTQRENYFVRSDISSEFSRDSDIQNGNVEKVKENLKEIRKDFYKGKGVLSSNPLRNTIYHFAISAGIIARVCIDAGLSHNTAYTLSDIYIQKADMCSKPEEVIVLLEQMQIDYATRMQDYKKGNTISIHVNHAIDYIFSHLHTPLTMEELAQKESLTRHLFANDTMISGLSKCSIVSLSQLP